MDQRFAGGCTSQGCNWSNPADDIEQHQHQAPRDDESSSSSLRGRSRRQLVYDNALVTVKNTFIDVVDVQKASENGAVSRVSSAPPATASRSACDSSSDSATSSSLACPEIRPPSVRGHFLQFNAPADVTFCARSNPSSSLSTNSSSSQFYSHSNSFYSEDVDSLIIGRQHSGTSKFDDGFDDSQARHVQSNDEEANDLTDPSDGDVAIPEVSDLSPAEEDVLRQLLLQQLQLTGHDSWHEEYNKVPLDSAGRLSSIGSIGHGTGACRICAFVSRKSGCIHGIDCSFVTCVTFNRRGG